MHVHWFSGIFQCIFRFCCYLNAAASFFLPKHALGCMSASISNNILLYIPYASALFSLALGSLLYPVYFASISQSPYLFNVTAVGSKCCFHISFLEFDTNQERHSDTHMQSERARERRLGFVRTPMLYGMHTAYTHVTYSLFTLSLHSFHSFARSFVRLF